MTFWLIFCAFGVGWPIKSPPISTIPRIPTFWQFYADTGHACKKQKGDVLTFPRSSWFGIQSCCRKTRRSTRKLSIEMFCSSNLKFIKVLPYWLNNLLQLILFAWLTKTWPQKKLLRFWSVQLWLSQSLSNVVTSLVRERWARHAAILRCAFLALKCSPTKKNNWFRLNLTIRRVDARLFVFILPRTLTTTFT